MKKRGFALLVGLIILMTGCATAERSVELPHSHYVIEIPDWMRYSEAEDEYNGVEAYVSEMLEIDYTAYPKAVLIAPGAAESLREVAEESAAKGNEVELRQINGIEMLCFRTMDESDKAPCIGYVFVSGEWIVEVDFWYSTEEAANLTTNIISSIHE
jgi:hypothetical protein